MKIVIMSLVSLVLSTSTIANAAKSKSVFRCQSAYAGFTIEKSTSKLIGTYNSSHGSIALNCVNVKNKQSELTVHYKCSENRAGEGRILAEVTGGGFTGLTQVSVLQEQIYPLAPVSVETIACKF